MEEVMKKKQNLRSQAGEKLAGLSEASAREKMDRLERNLMEFANFLEAETILFYLKPAYAVDNYRLINNCLQIPKKIVLPFFEQNRRITLWKISSLEKDLVPETLQPDTFRCKKMDFKEIDIAVLSGISFDDKGARLGSGHGNCDRMIPKLPNTVRKVALAFTEQVVPHVPMESHDKFVDIIITDSRIIYKI